MHNDKRIVLLAAALLGIGCSLISGCMMKVDTATLDRQVHAVAPWWFGSSVPNGVYSPAVRDEVYSTETMTTD